MNEHWNPWHEHPPIGFLIWKDNKWKSHSKLLGEQEK